MFRVTLNEDAKMFLDLALSFGLLKLCYAVAAKFFGSRWYVKDGGVAAAAKRRDLKSKE